MSFHAHELFGVQENDRDKQSQLPFSGLN